MSDLYNYRAKVVKIVDADTVDVLVDLGFKMFTELRLRLMGIDAPERFTEAGKAATAWLTEQIPVGTNVTIETFKDKAGKYGRYLAVIKHDGVDLNQELVKQGHAEVYDV